MPTNDHGLVNNQRFITINPKAGIEVLTLAGILNSTIALFSKYRFGRPVGVEGNLDTTVIDVKMMLVPDPTVDHGSSKQRVANAFEKLTRRKALMFLSEQRLRQMAQTAIGKAGELEGLSDLTELDMPDRRELDDAVLEMIGIEPHQRKELIDELYAYLKEFFEAVRQKEEKAIVNKNKSKRRGPAKPSQIASEIHKAIIANEPGLLLAFESDFLDTSKPFETYDLPPGDFAQPYNDMVTPHAVKFLRGDKKQVGLITTSTQGQAELMAFLANDGKRGLVRLPRDEQDNRRVLDKFRTHVARRNERLRELVRERVADEEMQMEVLSALAEIIGQR